MRFYPAGKFSQSSLPSTCIYIRISSTLGLSIGYFYLSALSSSEPERHGYDVVVVSIIASFSPLLSVEVRGCSPSVRLPGT